MADNNRAATRFCLWLMGSLQAAFYGLIAVRSDTFAFGASDRPVLAVVVLFVAATLCYFVALACVLRWNVHAVDWPVVVLFAVLGRLILLPSQPILEIDFYRYLWDGRAVLSGANPYHYSPFEIEEAAFDREPPDEVTGLVATSRQSAAVQTIFERVHWRAVPTVYPPAAQAVFAVAAWATPVAAPLESHVLVLKTIFVLFDLGAVGVLIALLRHLHLPGAWSLAYAWCPLVLKEVANSGHLDAIAVFFTTLAVYLLLRWPSLLGAVAGVAMLGIAILSKSYPLVLLPVVAAWLLARFRAAGVLPLLVVPVVVAAGYLPFAGPAARIGGHHAGSGLGTFLTEWESNDYLFMLVYDNIRASTADATARHVLVPAAWREALQRHLWAPAHDELGLPMKASAAFVATQGLMGTLLVLLCLRWGWQIYQDPQARSLLRGVFRTLAWSWLLSSAQNPWYLLWCLPFMIFDGRGCWFLLPGLVWCYYVRFWLEAQPWDERPFAEADLVWLEYAPFFLVLVIESWRLRLSGGAAPCVAKSC